MKTTLITAIGSYAAPPAIASLRAMGHRVIGCDIYPAAWNAASQDADAFFQAVLCTDKEAYIAQLEEAGYTVKYNFYRSTKKASKYKSMLMKTGKTYTNTRGKKGTMYYYKARIQVYDAEGKLIARTALKQCRYANRKWTR